MNINFDQIAQYLQTPQGIASLIVGFLVSGRLRDPVTKSTQLALKAVASPFAELAKFCATVSEETGKLLDRLKEALQDTRRAEKVLASSGVFEDTPVNSAYIDDFTIWDI